MRRTISTTDDPGAGGHADMNQEHNSVVANHHRTAERVEGRWTSDEARYRDFARAIDRIRDRLVQELGKEDVNYIKRVRSISRALEVAGRLLIHFSLEPVTFSTGVVLLWLHKQLEVAEIGHPTLHGTYDRLEGAEKFRSDTFVWDFPVDEESWRYGHNIRHHQYTNIAGKDPDIHFGQVRLDEHTPNRLSGLLHLATTLALAFPNFAFVMNAHFTGLIDVYLGNGQTSGFDFIKDRSPRSILKAHWKALRKGAPYFAKNFVLYPALAGPFFQKVLLGNWLAEVLRDLYTAASIYCGHIGDDVRSYPAGTHARSRGEWYAMQVEATNDFEVPQLLSVLCGALDRQIEHHLFPRLPPNRLREVSREVRSVCEAHRVTYRSAPWPAMLAKAFRRVAALNARRVDAGAT